MGFKFCKFISLVHDYIFPSLPKYQTLQELLALGFSPYDDNGTLITKLGFENANEDTRYAYFTGRRNFPKKIAKKIKNGFYAEDDFKEEVNALIDEPGDRDFSNDLTAEGFPCSPSTLNQMIWDITNAFLHAFADGTDTISQLTGRREVESILIADQDCKCANCMKPIVIKHGKFMSELYFQVFYNNEQYYLLNPSVSKVEKVFENDEIKSSVLVCKKCRDKLEKLEDYALEDKIKELKQNQVTTQTDELNEIEAKESIAYILDRINEYDFEAEKIYFSTKAVDPSKKIESDNYRLYNNVRNYNNYFYKYIEKYLGDFDRGTKSVWGRFASIIRDYYEVQASANFTQDELITIISKEILKIARMPDSSRNLANAAIVTSFFIQNCEVFDEISK